MDMQTTNEALPLLTDPPITPLLHLPPAQFLPKLSVTNKGDSFSPRSKQPSHTKDISELLAHKGTSEFPPEMAFIKTHIEADLTSCLPPHLLPKMEILSDVTLRANYMSSLGRDDFRSYGLSVLFSVMQATEKKGQEGLNVNLDSLTDRVASSLNVPSREFKEDVEALSQFHNLVQGRKTDEIIEAIQTAGTFLPTVYLNWIIGELYSEVLTTNTLSSELDQQAGKAILSLSAIEIPPRFPHVEHLSHGRSDFSRALILARDTLARWGNPHLFHHAHKSIGNMTGIEDYGYRFMVLSHLNLLSDIDPNIYGEFIEISNRMSYLVSRGETLTAQDMFFMDSSTKGVWDPVIDSLLKDLDLAKKIGEASVAHLKHPIDPLHYGTRFGKGRALAINLENLISSAPQQAAPLLDQLDQCLKEKPDTVRMRVAAPTKFWQRFLETVQQKHISTNLLFALTTHTGKTDQAWYVPLEAIIQYVKNDDTAGLDEEFVKQLKQQDVRLKKGAEVIDLMSAWSNLRHSDAEPFTSLFWRNKIDFFGLGKPIPSELQLVPFEYEGTSIALNNWLARFSYKLQ